jgi:hypothetical protein
MKWTEKTPCTENPIHRVGKASTGEKMPGGSPTHADAPYGIRFAEKPECIKKEKDLMSFLVSQYMKNNEA